ncbi:MAG: antibiotic biosynthesis monooxygenase [Bacteroidota bacterium]|nr:antibiotic biosynthesis monooxygenase [Bacteroidota bacterium]
MLRFVRRLTAFPVLFCCCLLYFQRLPAQTAQHYIRIARIVVDSAQLVQYKAALKEGVKSAIQKEPGVLQLYAVYDKQQPTHVTVFEIYASVHAYQLHIQTEHFKKYKAAVQSMVQSLELTDVEPIALGKK